MPNEQYLSYGKNKLHLMRWWWSPLCSRPTCLIGAHWNNSLLVDMSLHYTCILDVKSKDGTYNVSIDPKMNRFTMYLLTQKW